MKRTNTLYWTITGLFGAFMLFTSIPQILVSADAVTFMATLGYPGYFVPFIGIAKVLGVIGIIIPGFPRIKEWAYAGLFFDLVGAVYSVTATVGFKVDTLFIVLPLIFLFVSYFLYHKKLKAAR